MPPEVLLALAREVAAEAGGLARRMRAEGVDVAGTKSSQIDIVTAADKACERLIRDRILGRRPDDGFLGEEGDDIAGTTGVRWIVDPIDGTVNYLYGIERYAISIAAEVDDEVVAGVVFNPATGEEFRASRGAGAFRGDRPIRARVADSLAVSLVGTGFNYVTDLRREQAVAAARMLPHVRDIRREGSCALDLCSVASGRLDAYVEAGTHLWDWAAGALIATEAGARFEVARTPPGSVDSPVILAAADEVFDRFEALARQAGFVG